jgi:hypothetical protein
MSTLLPRNIAKRYGGVTFSMNKPFTVTCIDFNPTEFMAPTDEQPPLISCSMYIVPREDIIKKYKDTDTYIGKNYVDAIPLIKQHLHAMLDDDDHFVIDSFFDTYYNSDEVTAFRSEVIQRQKELAENKSKVIKGLERHSADAQSAKTVICIFDIVNKSYHTSPHNVLRLRRTPKGIESVLDFSMTFCLQNLSIDIDLVSDVLRDMLSSEVERDLRVKQDHHNGLLLITTNANEKPMPEATTILWNTDGQVDYAFENYAAASISPHISNRIIAEIGANAIRETTHA